jgi:hypothetical protein
MKRQALMILTTLSFLVMLTATSVHGQSSIGLVANIPFEFVIGNRAFPAGEYSFIYKYTNVIQIQSQERGESMFFLTRAAKGTETRNELGFNRYGDKYFLSRLRTDGDDAGRAVRMSSSERELVQARSGMARSSPEPKMVSVVIVGNKR